MRRDSGKFNVCFRPETPVRDVLPQLASSPDNKYIPGFAVIVDADQRVIGAFTDGDLRRAISKGVGIETPIGEVGSKSPLALNSNLPKNLLIKTLREEANIRGKHYSSFDKIILIDDDGIFADVVPLSEVMSTSINEKFIAVYGMGFVGLTLAATMANAGLNVVGIDIDKERVATLNSDIAPFYENGLDALLSSIRISNPMRYTSDPTEIPADIHIITVGTPLNAEGKPSLTSVEAACTTIAGILKKGDLVIFRSTLPMGTTRAIAKPILEQSGLVCGQDFSLSFAPERTVEGNALEELRTLPQIIGGYDQNSTRLTAELFSTITRSIVEVSSLEEAELVKLINNSFRDLVFAFSNEVANICDDFNINAFGAIHAANEGYPRNKVPLPSPGVGGICLAKDPILFSQPMGEVSSKPQLSVIGRSINGKGPEYIFKKIERFARSHQTDINQLKILIVGLAFKGVPETSDTRESVALDLARRLPDQDNLWIKDFVIPEAEVEDLGLKPCTGQLDEEITNFDVVLFMNNHYRNVQFNITESLSRIEHPILVFDGWSQFNGRDLEGLDFVTYSTMGYISA